MAPAPQAVDRKAGEEAPDDEINQVKRKPTQREVSAARALVDHEEKPLAPSLEALDIDTPSTDSALT